MKQRLHDFARKRDTRKKIQLGGLIIKANLHEESTAVLLGLLLEAQEKLQDTQSEKVRLAWKVKGELAFLEIK